MNYGYRKPSVFSVNVLYLVLALLLLLVGFMIQSQRLYTGIIVTEYVLILIPNIIFIKMKGLSLRGVLKLNGFTMKQLLYTVLIVIFSYPIAVFFNMIILNIVNMFTDFVPTTVPLPMTSREFWVSFFIIAVTPGICEEVMFRGTMLSAYESLGYKRGIIITALLFGIFHFNIANLVGPAFLGIVLGFVALKSNSIYLPIIGHTINNTIALAIGYFATRYTEQLDNIDTTLDNEVIPELMAIIVSTVIIGIIALLCGIVVYRLIKNFPTKYRFSGLYRSPNRTSLSYIPVVIVILIFISLTWFTFSLV